MYLSQKKEDRSPKPEEGNLFWLLKIFFCNQCFSSDFRPFFELSTNSFEGNDIFFNLLSL